MNSETMSYDMRLAIYNFTALMMEYSYGIKDPVWRTQLVDVDEPERGDIVVFKYPLVLISLCSR